MSDDDMTSVDEQGYLVAGVARIGKDHPVAVLWQGDKRWGARPYGFGGLRVSAAGCVATSIAEAARRLGVLAGADPRTVLDRSARVEPPVFDPGSSRAYISRMARAMDLRCDDDPIVATKGDDAQRTRHLRFAIARAIADGGVCLLHVDHTGDDVGDHWVCAHQVTRTHVWATDPATARIEKIDIETLTTTTSWSGRDKTYRVLRARPLTI